MCATRWTTFYRRRAPAASSHLVLRPYPFVPPPLTQSSLVVVPSMPAVLLLPLACCCFVATTSTGCYVYPSDVQDPCAGKTCSFGAHCVASVDGLVARCQCLETCNSYGDAVDSWPICSTDGVDYDNVCEMRKAACRLMTDIEKKYDGKCGEYRRFHLLGHSCVKMIDLTVFQCLVNFNISLMCVALHLHGCGILRLKAHMRVLHCSFLRK